jgi:hypothetical protein
VVLEASWSRHAFDRDSVRGLLDDFSAELAPLARRLELE